MTTTRYLWRLKICAVLYLLGSCALFQGVQLNEDGSSSAQLEFQQVTNRIKTPCRHDRDCEFVAVDGPCCVCGITRSKKSKYPLDQSRLQALCHEMSLQMDEEDLVACDCGTDVPIVRCVEGACQI